VDDVTGALPSAAFWAGRRVLLTGHTGFKGAWLALWLRRLGADVLGISLPGEPPSPRLWDDVQRLGVTEIGADLAEPGWEREVTAFAPEVVLHLAAQALVPVGYRAPLRTFASNVMGTARVLDVVSSLSSVSVAVMVTTDKVYDPRQPPPHVETDFLGGHDPYAASKAAAELVVSSWPRTHALVVTARAGNVIGGGDWSPDRLVPDVVRAWSAGETAVLRMPTAVRPWQHVLQPLHGYLLYAERLAAGDDLPRALNFGPDDSQVVTVGQLVEYAATTWRDLGGSLPEPPTRTVPMPDVAETGHLEIDSTLAAKTLGWHNVVDWRTAIEWTVDWYRRSPTTAADAMMAEQLAAYETRVRARG
jgi:CDP-glucose 4,6-dehydratase